jgi:hypothetical protein
VITADPKTITDLGVKQGERVRLIVRGVDEKYALNAIARTLSHRLSLRVFIASTIEDLVEFRVAAADAVRSTSHVAEMVGPLADATPDEVTEICRAKVQSCDACIIIVGERRGSGPQDEQEQWGTTSFTEIETREAINHGIPVFAYFVDREAFTKLPVEDNYPDYSRRLRWIEGFREKLAEKGVFRWGISDPEKLRFLVYLDIDALGQGTVRPSMPPPRFLW